jgi:hypothetical protein
VAIAVGILATVAGCSTVGVRTEGTSGPLAWRAGDLAVEPRIVQGQQADTYSFTLHVKNLGDRPLTFTQMHRTVYQAGGGQPGQSTTSGRWELKPGGEWRFPLYSYQFCNVSSGCLDRGISAPLWRIVLTGTDDQNRTVSVPIDIALPSQPARVVDLSPASKSMARSAPTPVEKVAPSPASPQATSATRVAKAPIRLASVPVPVWKPGFEWEYRRESPTSQGTFVWSVNRTDAIDGVDFHVVKSGARELFYRTHDLAFLMETIPEGVDKRQTPAIALPWPLAPGQAWTWTYTLERPVLRETSQEVRACAVEGQEQVTVPAGTFDTLKIVCRDPRTQLISQETWYSPDVKQRVRDRFPITGGYEERQLLRYRID